MVLKLNSDIKTHKKGLTTFNTEKETLQENLKKDVQDSKSTLLGELNKVETDMKKGFALQKTVDTDLTLKIGELKKENTELEKLLISLKKRMEDLQMNVGSNEKYL
jgi:hypothetical protein